MFSKRISFKRYTLANNLCAIRVHKTVGPALSESVYEDALSDKFEVRILLKMAGLLINFNVERLKPGTKRLII